MAWFLGQSLLFIVLAFVLGLLVGWLIWGRRRVVQLSFSSGAGSSSSVASVPAPAAAPDIESEPAAEPALVGAAASSSTMDGALDSTVDYGSLSTVDEVDRGPAPAGAGHGAYAHVPSIAEKEEVASGPDAAEPLEAEPEPEPEPDLQPEPEPVLVGAAASPAASSATPAGSAAGSAAATAVEADDDLKRIEGIGPKMAAALNTGGIRTFRQLSETDEPTLRAAIRAAGLRFAPSLVTWARQARLLADGDEDGFNVLTKQLIAGREARRD